MRATRQAAGCAESLAFTVEWDLPWAKEFVSLDKLLIIRILALLANRKAWRWRAQAA
jgi:hypothetical protein